MDSIRMENDVKVKKLVNGVNVTEFPTNTLFKNTNYTQMISGRKSFENGIDMDVVTSTGLIDGLNITTSAFVTLHTKQTIHGRKNLTGNFVSNHITVAGKYVCTSLRVIYRT